MSRTEESGETGDAEQQLQALLASGAVFHEQQRLLLCGVHCLNSLFCNHAPARRDSAGLSPIYTKVSSPAAAANATCVRG